MSARVDRPSTLRQLLGAICLGLSFFVLALGFGLLVRALQHGGYGTSSITWALVALGAGGGLLGTGIALLIWEYSIRHGVRH